MLAQLKTVDLIKEAIKLAFFRLVEYLEHQHLWIRLQAQNGQKQRSFFCNSSVYSYSEKLRLCEKMPRNGRSRTTLCTTPFTEQSKLALTSNFVYSGILVRCSQSWLNSGRQNRPDILGPILGSHSF